MSASATFNPRVVIGMIVAGAIAFAALLLLLAYGGRVGMDPQGRAHVQSAAATGYKGLVSLVGEFREARIIDRPEDQYSEDLVVVALQSHNRPDQIRQLLDRRQGRATLLILPKWLTVRDPVRRGWVRAVSPDAGDQAAGLLGRKLAVEVESNRPIAVATGEDMLASLSIPVPSNPQTISGEDLTTLVGLPDGGALVARLGDQPHYVVADPDLLNNHGLKDPATARAALELIDSLNATGAETVNFDTSSDYAAGKEGPNLLRLAFEPPFLAMTLALLFAALLAGLHGAWRFGPIRRDIRAIAFGKGALVENGAGLIRLAGRESRLGGAYADVVRQDVARSTGASHWLAEGELDKYLDRFARPDRPSFTQLAAELAAARDRSALVAAARALFQWKKEIIR
jgi:hypothetical protein